ncbi:MAG: pre-peptidase C-terminal domain-containing protein, partial [Arenicella sp.]|nr:pre-peptidase C-terminal domain-containing protein [Arenicella sp.]
MKTFSLQSVKLAALFSLLLHSAQSIGATLPDMCSTQGATSTQNLTDGQQICVQDTNTVYHAISGASNHSSIAITTMHGSGDLSLYVDDGRWPVLDSRSSESETAGTNSECVIINNPRSFYVYVAVNGSRSGASMVIDLGATSCRTGGTNPDPDPGTGGSLTNGVSKIVSANGQNHPTFTLSIPSNTTNLEISISGGTGSADLYAKTSPGVSLTDYTYRPWLAGNNETISVASPVAGSWSVMVAPYSNNTFTNVTLKATWNGGSTNPDPDPDPTNPGALPDVCATEAADKSVTTLTSGVPICMPGSVQREGYSIRGSDEHSSLAISTAYGQGNLNLFGKNGGWPATDGSDPVVVESKHIGNTECVIIRSTSGNLSEFWSNVNITGARDKASIVVDLGATTCRVTPGAVDPGNDGYKLNSTHVIIYRFDFNGESAESVWPETQMEQDMQRVKAYFQEQSYGAFNVTWEVKDRINAGNKSSYTNQREWKDFVYGALEARGANPSFPGLGNVYMFTAPPLLNLNSTAAPPELNIFHYIPGTVAHEIVHALGLHHSMSVEAGNQVMDASRDSISNYGNVFSMMGMGAQSAQEINLMYKSYFDGWLNVNTDVPVINSSGTYRIYAHDFGTASGHGAAGDIGIRLKSADGSLTYWVEFRTRASRTDYEDVVRNGVLVNVQGYKENESDSRFWNHRSAMLDFTPNSKDRGIIDADGGDDKWDLIDETDAPLAVGKSWTDPSGKLRIRPLQTGGSVGFDATGYI